MSGTGCNVEAAKAWRWILEKGVPGQSSMSRANNERPTCRLFETICDILKSTRSLSEHQGLEKEILRFGDGFRPRVIKL